MHCVRGTQGAGAGGSVCDLDELSLTFRVCETKMGCMCFLLERCCCHATSAAVVEYLHETSSGDARCRLTVISARHMHEKGVAKGQNDYTGKKVSNRFGELIRVVFKVYRWLSSTSISR